MKVKELIAHLSKLNQDALVVYSHDDEGNGYQDIRYTPSEGRYISYGCYGDYVAKKDLEKGDTEGVEAVCVN